MDEIDFVKPAPGVYTSSSADYTRRARLLLEKAKKLRQGSDAKGHEKAVCEITPEGIESLLGAGAEIIELNNFPGILPRPKAYRHSVTFGGYTFVARTDEPYAHIVSAVLRESWQKPFQTGTYGGVLSGRTLPNRVIHNRTIHNRVIHNRTLQGRRI